MIDQSPPPLGPFANLRSWAQSPGRSIDDAVEGLQRDQIERWRLGRPLPAETYLNCRQELASDPVGLDLVVGELALRREAGEDPQLAEYQDRFPQFAEELAAWFVLDDGWNGDAGDKSTAHEPRQHPAATPVNSIGSTVLSPAPAGGGGLTETLRRRLRVVATAFIVFAGGYGSLVLMNRPSGSGVGAYGWPGVALAGGVILWIAAMVGLLRRPKALRQLRRVELAIFGAFAVLMGGMRYLAASATLTGQFLGPAHFEAVYELELVRSNAIWFSILVVYGVAIPNTGRRCLAVTASLAALAPVTTLVATASAGVSTGTVAYMTLGTLMVVSVGGTIGVFGATRLAALQEAARELGQYRLARRLGAGGMGEVWLAEHRLLKRPCAVKLIHPDRAGDPNAARRFEREVRGTAMLTHPNTVEVYDFGRTEDGRLYYVMEYLSGRTLQQLVEEDGRLPAPRAVRFLRQVCGALAEAHAAGLVHRDVKPSNVLVCRQGGQSDIAKLLDFGLVSLRRSAEPGPSLTQEGDFFGTPGYAAPEQVEDVERADARSDLYAVGAVGYFLLTGRPPFARDTVMKTLLAQAHEPPPPPKGVAVELAAIVLRCLAKDPAGRFAAASELDQALAEWEREGQGETQVEGRESLAVKTNR